MSLSSVIQREIRILFQFFAIILLLEQLDHDPLPRTKFFDHLF